MNQNTEQEDIDEQKALRLELEEQRNYAQMLLNTVPSAVFSINNASEIISWNKRAEQITGYAKEEIIGKTCAAFANAPCDIKCGLCSGNLDKPIYNRLSVIRNKSGEIIQISKNIDALRNHEGKKIGIIECFEDITERKMHELEMKKKENLLSAVADSIKIFLDDRDYLRAAAAAFELIGKALDVDRVYLLQNGYNSEGNAVTSQKVEWNSGTSAPQIDNPEFQNIPLDDFKTWHEMLKTGKGFQCITKEVIDDDFRTLLEVQDILSFVMFPIFVSGQLWGIIGFDECKYDRTWADGEFSTMSAFANSLERAIERRGVEEELEAAKLAAESANIMKSRFLANMSHEIRTPMNGIMGFMELLQTTNLSIEQQEFIREAKSASQILLYVINDILDFSKIEAGKLTVEKARFNIRTVIEDAVSIVAPKANEKNIEIHVYIYSSVPEVILGDAARLRQVVNNLVSNAVKFTEKGEVIIEVSSSDLADGKVRIDFNIKDTGIGIDADVIGKLFKPFTQADSSMTRRFGGTGLGLAISRELVRLMDGDISAESVLGKGSIFSFYIYAENVEKSLGHKVLTKIKNENILIVDDNKNNRRIIRDYLEASECKVFEAAGADEAITTILLNAPTKNRIAAAIIDYQMPSMDGCQLAEVLKNIPTANSVKKILLTSSSKVGEAKIIEERGFSGYLTKPVKRDELLNCVAAVLALKEPDEEYSEKVTKYTANEESNSLKPRILLAEDSEINQKIVEKMLKLKDYTCDIALDGAEAVKLFKERDYDIVLMDCQMPLMDGYESTAKIREIEGQNKHTVIIALTANAMEGDRKKCIDAGMDYYISKPLKFEVLFKMIEDCVKAGNAQKMTS